MLLRTAIWEAVKFLYVKPEDRANELLGYDKSGDNKP